MSRVIPACAALFFFCLLVPAAASGAAATGPVLHCSGALPAPGTIVLRSGMAWLTESAPIFQHTATALRRELTAMGFTVVPRPPSVAEPMPQTPMPASAQSAMPEAPGLTPREKAHRNEPTTRKATELAQTGKLPPLKLKPYLAPEKDADLPPSVTAVTAPDVYRALYARSQQQGVPVVRSFAIPGRFPSELTDDASVADYALVVRFATVRGRGGALSTLFPGGPPGVSLAASNIRGVGALGFGPPSQPAPPGNTYGTPGGYMRGYEGSAPNDFWGRDSDFRQRDYQFKYGPQPNYASPPSNFAPGHSPVPGPGPGTFPAVDTSGHSEWHALILDLVPLAPLRSGEKPIPIWQGTVRKPGGTNSLAKNLPELAQRLLAACAKAS